MKEFELAELFTDYFNDGYEVYNEVPAGGGVIDFVATDNSICIGGEVKTSFGLAVIEQAFRKRYQFHYIYVCVPSTRADTRFREMLCRDYGIGVLEAIEHYGSYRIREVVKSRLNRKARVPELKQYMKQSVAGSQSDRITAFGHTVRQINTHLDRYGESHIDDVLNDISYHYASLSTAKSSLRKWIRSGVIEGIEWNRGVLKKV